MITASDMRHMNILKKTRFHSRWKIDHDYLARLSDQDRAWYQKFIGEYYRAEFGPDPLHSEEQAREIYASQNAADRDVVTANPELVAETLKKNQRKLRPCHVARYYQVQDYAMFREVVATNPPLPEPEREPESEEISDGNDLLKKTA